METSILNFSNISMVFMTMETLYWEVTDSWVERSWGLLSNMCQQHRQMAKKNCQVFLQTKGTAMKSNKSLSKAKVYC